MVKVDNPDASRSSLLKSSIKYSEALFTSETVVDTENLSYQLFRFRNKMNIKRRKREIIYCITKLLPRIQFAGGKQSHTILIKDSLQPISFSPSLFVSRQLSVEISEKSRN